MSDARETGVSPSSDRDTALIDETMKKSGLIWIAAEGFAQPRAAWHIWHDGAAYVVVGETIEQPLTELAFVEQATVTVRSKDKGGRLVSWVADVHRLTPGGEEWNTVVPALAKERLNAPDGDEQKARWARECHIIRLTPTREVVEAPGAMPRESLAAPPIDTPAVTAGGPLPMIGAKRRRVDRRPYSG